MHLRFSSITFLRGESYSISRFVYIGSLELVQSLKDYKIKKSFTYSTFVVKKIKKLNCTKKDGVVQNVIKG